jgi:hypothetical protein|tara:strand:+ start:355 stop:504 length:150 start_codon:yes stop_codon:yes gene_type:complete
VSAVIACTFFGAGGMLGYDQLITVGVLQNSVLIVTEIFGLHRYADWRKQ